MCEALSCALAKLVHTYASTGLCRKCQCANGQRAMVEHCQAASVLSPGQPGATGLVRIVAEPTQLFFSK